MSWEKVFTSKNTENKGVVSAKNFAFEYYYPASSLM